VKLEKRERANDSIIYFFSIISQEIETKRDLSKGWLKYVKINTR
jgi:hypothetical protein